jgi:hypothetical protein
MLLATLAAVAGVLCVPQTTLGAPAATTPAPIVLSSSHLSVSFAANDPEHITSLLWTNSSGTQSSNLAAAGGSATCGDPSEFFGESYAAPENNQPVPVFESHVATGSVKKGVLKVKGAKKDCDGNTQTPTVSTSYSVGSTGLAASVLTVTRTFSLQGKSYPGAVGIRPYIPRLPESLYSEVLYPNATSTGSQTDSLCGPDCFTTTSTWNGLWFADLDPSNGDAMIMSRVASDKSPIEATNNEDSASASNGSSFVLVQPSGGYTKTIKETETLCFVDLTSWPQSMRTAGKEPSGC